VGDALAQEAPKSTGLVVSPAIIDVSLDRGKVYSREIVVKSTSTETVGFVVSVESLVLADFATVSEKEIIPPEWIKAEQQEFILNPGEVRKVNIVFNPSINTPPGGYYGTIYIQPVADLSLFTNDKTTSVPKIGILLLAKIEGKTINNVVFTGFKNKLISNNRETIILGFENLGNVHAMPSGEVVLTNLLTRSQQRLGLAPSLIFPNSSKEIKLSLESRPAQGIYRFTYKNNVGLYSAYILFISKAGILVFVGLTFLLMLFTLYIRKYFMSKRHEEKLLET
jgi:hypothetical protein